MKDKGTAYIFWILGIHQFYLGRTGRGFLQLVTLGGLGIWWLLDGITLGRQVRAINHSFVIDELAVKYKYADKDIKGIKRIKVKAEVFKVCEEMKLKVYEGYMWYKDAKVSCGE